MNIFGHLRKSEKKILEVLANSNGKLSQKDIIGSTKLSERTVKYGLKRLIAFGCLKERPVLSDMRSKLYFVQERGESG